MRGAVILAALATLGVLPARAGKGGAQEEQGGFALYAGASPFGGGQAVFLLGEEWTPQLFDNAPRDVPVGAQGRLVWRQKGAQREVVEFEPAEVPVRPEDLARGEGEPTILEGRPRRGAALLLLALAPGDARVLTLLGRWYKQKQLTPGEWAFLLRAGRFKKALAAAAKKEPEAAYELLGLHFQEGQWGAAAALLRGRRKMLDPLLHARHAEAEPCAKEAKGLPLGRLLELAALHAQGKRRAAEKGLKVLAPKASRLPAALCLAAADLLPDHEVYRPDRPRALLRRVPAFLKLLQP